MQAVKDLSIGELKALIGEVVEEKFREILVDPDTGLVLRLIGVNPRGIQDSAMMWK